MLAPVSKCCRRKDSGVEMVARLVKHLLPALGLVARRAASPFPPQYSRGRGRCGFRRPFGINGGGVAGIRLRARRLAASRACALVAVFRPGQRNGEGRAEGDDASARGWDIRRSIGLVSALGYEKCRPNYAQWSAARIPLFLKGFVFGAIDPAMHAVGVDAQKETQRYAGQIARLVYPKRRLLPLEVVEKDKPPPGGRQAVWRGMPGKGIPSGGESVPCPRAILLKSCISAAADDARVAGAGTAPNARSSW